MNRVALLVGRGLLATLLIFSTWQAPANAPGLSSDQLQQLDRGEVVLLDVLPPGGAGKPGQGGTAITLVRASPDAVWRVLVDYRGHRGLYPRIVGAEVLEANHEHALVRYVLGVGPLSFGFHVNNHADAARRRLEWRLDQARPNDLFQDSWGYWQIEPRGRGVVLTHALAARTVLPAFLIRGAERESLVGILKAVRDRAEHRG